MTGYVSLSPELLAEILGSRSNAFMPQLTGRVPFAASTFRKSPRLLGHEQKFFYEHPNFEQPVTYPAPRCSSLPLTAISWGRDNFGWMYPCSLNEISGHAVLISTETYLEGKEVPLLPNQVVFMDTTTRHIYLSDLPEFRKQFPQIEIPGFPALTALAPLETLLSIHAEAMLAKTPLPKFHRPEKTLEPVIFVQQPACVIA